MNFLTKLSNRLKLQLGEEYELFSNNLDKKSQKSFRVNTIKISETGFQKKHDIKKTKIPWVSEGYFTKEKIGETIEHYQGLIYVQEAASMLAVELLDPKPDEKILDLTAAPGSKTTQIAAKMENTGVIVANEINFKRLKTLKFNLKQMGVVNTIITKTDAAKFKCMEKFDRILLDAPCSNLGQIRKKPEIADNWSIRNVKNHSIIQKKIIDNAVKHLADDGTLVYSTCTFSPEENEEVVSYALEKHNLTIIDEKPKLNYSPGITNWEGKKYSEEISKSIRIYPHQNNTDGFFAAKLKK